MNKEKSIQQVKDNNFNFYLHGYEFAKTWVKNRLKPFTSEDLRNAYYKANKNKPREERVWGPIVSSLKNDGLISFHGYDKYKDPSGHGKISNVWVSNKKY